MSWIAVRGSRFAAIRIEKLTELGVCNRAVWNRTPEKKKAYTTTTERKSFGELSGLKEKLPRPVVDTRPYKNQENHIHHRNLSSVDPIFLLRKVLHWSRAVYGFFSPVLCPSPKLKFANCDRQFDNKRGPPWEEPSPVRGNQWGNRAIS